MNSLFKFINQALLSSTLLFLLCILVSCNNYKAEDLSKIKNKVVFIEEHTKGDGLQSGNFGDVMLLDLDSKKTYNLTNDDFYDLDPHFSHDGKFIYFQSNRSGSKMDRMISGVGGPYNTCILDIKTGEIRKVDFDYEKDTPEHLRSTLTDMQLTSDNAHFYFDAFPTVILRSTIKGDSLKVIKDYSQDEKAGFTIMQDLKLSYDDKYLAFRYEDINLESNDRTPKSRGLAIYELSSSRLKLIKVLPIYSVLCWTRDNRKIIYSTGSKISTYDIKEDKSDTFLDPSENNLIVRGVIMMNNNKIILLAKKVGEETGNYELAQYNLKNKKLEWLTNDGLQKDFVDVYTDVVEK